MTDTLRDRLQALEQEMRERTPGGFTIHRDSTYWADQIAALAAAEDPPDLSGIGLILTTGPDDLAVQPDGTVDRWTCTWDLSNTIGAAAQGPTWERALKDCLRCVAAMVVKLKADADAARAAAPSPLCPDCDHGIAGGQPCASCGGSGYAASTAAPENDLSAGDYRSAASACFQLASQWRDNHADEHAAQYYENWTVLAEKMDRLATARAATPEEQP